MRNWLLLIVVLLGVVGCKKPQSEVDNLPPETTIAIDSIQRTGELRLNANVHLHWYGSDADGFIDYFKVKVNEGVEQRYMVLPWGTLRSQSLVMVSFVLPLKKRYVVIEYFSFKVPTHLQTIYWSC